MVCLKLMIWMFVGVLGLLPDVCGRPPTDQSSISPPKTTPRSTTTQPSPSPSSPSCAVEPLHTRPSGVSFASGSPTPFNVELKQFAGQKVLGLRSGDPNFDVQLVDQVKGDGGRVRVTATVTPGPGASGPFMVPVTFDATNGSETLYAIGVVR